MRLVPMYGIVVITNMVNSKNVETDSGIQLASSSQSVIGTGLQFLIPYNPKCFHIFNPIQSLIRKSIRQSDPYNTPILFLLIGLIPVNLDLIREQHTKVGSKQGTVHFAHYFFFFFGLST